MGRVIELIARTFETFGLVGSEEEGRLKARGF